MRIQHRLIEYAFEKAANSANLARREPVYQFVNLCF